MCHIAILLKFFNLYKSCYVFADSLYLPINDVRGHNVDLKMVQLKTKTMTHVEVNVEGVPAAIIFTQTMRHSTFPAQGIYTMTMARLLQVRSSRCHQLC